MSREAMQMALEALELLAKYENPSTKIQVRKPKDGGPIVTMYPHKVATEAAALLRERLAQPEQEPVAWISDSPTKGNGKQLHWTKAEAWRWSSNITPLYTAIEAKMQEHDWVNVYYAHEIMIVPHYSKKKTFVLPGGREVKEQTLIDKGYKPAVSYLWPRPV